MGAWARVVESVASKYAFFPPTPPSYDYTIDDNKEIAIRSPHPSIQRLNGHVRFHFFSTPKKKDGSGGEHIFGVWVPFKPATACRATILYSHANATDIGQALAWFKDLSEYLCVNIFAYDYSGYGVSTGIPSVSNTLADAEAALAFLCKTYSLTEESIIVYGQSVGSGPTVSLGATHPSLAGVVLHSPLLSGMRVLNPELKNWPRFADVYPNCHLIKKVEAPTLILHGTSDEVINITHGKELFRLAKNPYDKPLWAEGHTHHNVELCRDYIPRLREFLAQVLPDESVQRISADAVKCAQVASPRYSKIGVLPHSERLPNTNVNLCKISNDTPDRSVMFGAALDCNLANAKKKMCMLRV